MPELITIPISIVELSAEYARPNLNLIMDRKEVVDRLYDRFKQWHIALDDLEVITDGKLSEQGVRFKLRTKRTSFFLGAGSCKLVRDDASWESATETIEILDTAMRTVAEIAKVEIGCYKTSISLHLQPKTLKFTEILQPFAPSLVLNVDQSPVTAIASVVRWKKRRITLDGSSQLANGVFIRFEREFESSSTYEHIAEQLQSDEAELFRALNVQEDRP